LSAASKPAALRGSIPPTYAIFLRRERKMTKTIAEILNDHDLIIVSFNEGEFCAKRRDTKQVLVVSSSLTELMDMLRKMYG